MALLLPPACLGAYHAGMLLGDGSRQPAVVTAIPGNHGLWIDPQALALGDVWAHPSHVAVLRLENRSEQAVSVGDWSPSCDCTAVEPRQFVVPPGGSRAVRVTLDLTQRRPQHVGLARHPLSVHLAPILTATPGSALPGWELKGIVRNRVSVQPTGIEFGDHCSQGEPPVTRKVRAVAHVSVDQLHVTSDHPMVSVVAQPIAGRANEFDLRLTPNPEMACGPFRGEVTIVAQTADGAKVPCGTVSFRGEMQPPVRLVPGTILLGEHPVGSTVTAELSVRFSIDGWTIGSKPPSHPHNSTCTTNRHG